MFTGDFDSQEDIINQFQLAPDALTGLKILFASYDCGGYDGEAFVLFEKDGKLYEVNGSHCSCYGLEGQWDPELTTKEALLMRISPSSSLHDSIKKGLFKVLEKL